VIQQAMLQIDESARRLRFLCTVYELCTLIWIQWGGVFCAGSPSSLQRECAGVDPQGKLIVSVAKTSKNEKIDIRLKDGILAAEVI